jgi:phage terminase large subunit
MAKPNYPQRKNENKITLPYNFKPRSYQLDTLSAMDSGIKRAVEVWHRRAGKDKTFLNYTIKKMYERIGTYYHLFPTYAQGKKTIWDGIGSDGIPFLSHFPEALIASKNETEMQIKTKNGSVWQVVGTDRNLDNLVGPNPVGCIFSEYSIQDPRAWTLLRPILRENKGWAVFIYTPRGQNHGWDLYRMAKENPEWHTSLLTILDTRRDAPGENGLPVLTEADIEAERREGMSEDMISQEYFCSFQGSLLGAYYLKEINEIEKEGHIEDIPWDPKRPVNTMWDLGYNDTNAIWFFQVSGSSLGFIDYEEDSGKGLSYYAKILQEKPYTYADHVMPHDIMVHDYGTGITRMEMGEELGIRPITVAPKLSLQEGINAARAMLRRSYFDKTKCQRGLDALRNYRKEWDEERKCFNDKPFHDWSSNGSDAYRTGAVGYVPSIAHGPQRVETAFDVFSKPSDTTYGPSVESDFRP